MGDTTDTRVGSGGPLSGRSVVVTRAAEQVAGLAAPLEALGAEVISMPVIEIAPPSDLRLVDDTIEKLGSYDWIILTSANGVERLDTRMRVHGLRVGDLASSRVAAVGSVTAERLRREGVEPSIVPVRYRAEGLVDALRTIGPEVGRRVLIARAEQAREVLPQELRALGFEVDVVPVYRVVTAHPREDVLELLTHGDVSAVVFASGGTARSFIEAVQSVGMDARKVLVGPVVVSYGPVTTEALHELGIPVDVEAKESTSASVVQALVERFGSSSRSA